MDILGTLLHHFVALNKILYQSGKGFNHLVEKEEISILVKNFIITAS